MIAGGRPPEAVNPRLTFAAYAQGMRHAAEARLGSDNRAVAAVEFALVCLPFALFLMAVMAAGMNFYFQQALDFAVQSAVRQVQIGGVPAAYTQADFLANVFCPSFGELQICANVSVDLHPVSDYQQLTTGNAADAPASVQTGGFSFCTGQPGQLMYLHVVYLPPSLNWLFGLGDSAGTIVSNAAFANENPTGVTVTQANGC